MIPTKLTVVEVFTQTKQYAVPLYQRPYVWGREGQWEPFWEDVEAIASHLANGEVAVPHFLGAVVLAQRESHGVEIARRDVIDGQQRLTTLQVLLAALRDEIHEAREAVKGTPAEDPLENLADSVSPLTRNRGIMRAPEVEKHKVWPTNSDRAVYVSVLSAGKRSALETAFPLLKQKYQKTPDPRPPLVEAYHYFSTEIRKFCAAHPSSSRHPLEAIFQAFDKHLHLVVIELEKEDDPQAIFESLNAHGAPLRASDLIRNHVFGRAAAQDEDADALYVQSWKQFDDPGLKGAPGFWRHVVKQGRLRHPRFELFFQHYLSARTGTEVTPLRVFQAFRQYWKDQKPEPKVRDELARIEHFAEAFRWFHEPSLIEVKRPVLGRFLRRMRVIDTSTFYPLVLFLLAEAGDRLAAGELDGIIKALESYLVRSWICARPTKSYSRIFTVLLKEIQALKTIDAPTIRAKLLAIKGDNAWPDDATFEAAWMRTPAYVALRSSGVQMVLGAIHEQMLTSKQEQVTIGGSLSVEHVMPQSWRDEWPLATTLPTTLPGQQTHEERRDALVQTFGNLTLLTQPLNSSVSNGPYAAKQAEYIQHALLRLNTYFHAVPVWDEAAIVTRGQTLFVHAKTIWKHGA
ncbi:MAG: DUF262 domain-containing protein [Myxococcaceae bacterium]|nr:MAG: DUF262 domain-containing protein [Myxococcaceae bacterium]